MRWSLCGLDRRHLAWVSATANPNAEWIARQITEAFPWDEAPAYLIRGRDRAYGTVFVRRVRAMGIRNRPTAPRSPWQIGYAGRFVGSMRREWLDHVVVRGEVHLRRIRDGYAGYDNRIPTPLALRKDTPEPRSVQSVGQIVSVQLLGGSHHRYVGISFSVGTGIAPSSGRVQSLLASERAAILSNRSRRDANASLFPGQVSRTNTKGH